MRKMSILHQKRDSLKTFVVPSTKSNAYIYISGIATLFLLGIRMDDSTFALPNRKISLMSNTKFLTRIQSLKGNALFTDYNDGVLTSVIKMARRYKRLSAQDESILSDRIQLGDASAENQLFCSNLLLVVTIAKTNQNRGLELDDLLQEGVIGLYNAVRAYDASKGKFATFATFYIQGSIEDALMRYGRTIHSPKAKVRARAAVEKAREAFVATYDRRPDLCELAESVGMEADELQSLLWETPVCCPIADTTPLGDEEDFDEDSYHPAYVSEGSADDDLLEKDGRKSVWRVLRKSLSARDAEIYAMYIGLEGKMWSQKELAQKYGLTMARIGQIVNQDAPSRLKKNLYLLS